MASTIKQAVLLPKAKRKYNQVSSIFGSGAQYLPVQDTPKLYVHLWPIAPLATGSREKQLEVVFVAVSDKQRLAVERRAEGRCEYCRMRLAGHVADIDHIVPTSRGGSDAVENLCLCCRRCNLNKSDFTCHTDPMWGIQAKLFNPRQDAWHTHFSEFNGHVVGKTTTGRATAVLMFGHPLSYISGDNRWGLISMIDDEVVYRQLNRLRALRLANRFTVLQSELEGTRNLSLSSPRERDTAATAMAVLELEIYSTRSRPVDIKRGLSLAESYLQSPECSALGLPEVMNIRQTLLQQAATALALQGKKDQALSLQTKAIRACELDQSTRVRGAYLAELRHQSFCQKHGLAATRAVLPDDIRRSLEIAQTGDISALSYLADCEIMRPGSTQVAESLLGCVSETLSACGYAQDFDYTIAVSLRRRWWALMAKTNQPLDLSLLAADLRLWKHLRLYNEVRELTWLLHNFALDPSNPQSRDVLEMLLAKGR